MRIKGLIEKNPKQGDLYFNRGLLNEREKFYEEAIKDYQLALELGYGEAAAAKMRLSEQMSYLAKIDRANPYLLGLREKTKAE
jgi:tetratricopeptide (TPR) repeat protein